MNSAYLHPFAAPTNDTYLKLVGGRGALIWDQDGAEYIDGAGGLFYNVVGHGRPELAAACEAQMRRLETYSSFEYLTNGPAEDLAATLLELSKLATGRVFLCSSGSEAVDSAVKLARIAHTITGQPDRTTVISRHLSYHGMNYAGTSLQGIAVNRLGAPFVPGVERVPHDELSAIRDLFEDHGDQIAAVIAEPVIAAGGVYPATAEYLQGLRHLCDEYGAYLIFDEVVTGFGRLGTWFAAHYFDVVPDFVVFAKGVTSGYLPLGGVILGPRPTETLTSDPDFFLYHGYTHSGHATVSAVAIEHAAIVQREGLLGRVPHIGNRIESTLGSLQEEGQIEEFRGAGAIIAAGLHPNKNARAVRGQMQSAGTIVRSIGVDSIVFCPPLVITDSELDRMMETFIDSVTA